jgi:hypothetical protein
MKASEEISIDFFIKKCIESGIDNQHEIVEAAKKEDEREAKRVKRFLLDGKSNPYEDHVEWEDCMECGAKLMFDDKQQEYFCPMCEKE